MDAHPHHLSIVLTRAIRPANLGAVRIYLAALLVIPALLTGCGKKAPPVAPRQPAMKAVSDLSARYEDGAMVLNWHHRPSSSAITGYVIYLAWQSDTQNNCPGCPLLFEKIDTLTLTPDQRHTAHGLTYTHRVDTTGGHTYKVVPVQTSGAIGPDSNLVEVEVSP